MTKKRCWTATKDTNLQWRKTVGLQRDIQCRQSGYKKIESNQKCIKNSKKVAQCIHNDKSYYLKMLVLQKDTRLQHKETKWQTSAEMEDQKWNGSTPADRLPLSAVLTEVLYVLHNVKVPEIINSLTLNKFKHKAIRISPLFYETIITFVSASLQKVLCQHKKVHSCTVVLWSAAAADLQRNQIAPAVTWDSGVI